MAWTGKCGLIQKISMFNQIYMKILFSKEINFIKNERKSYNNILCVDLNMHIHINIKKTHSEKH